MKKLPSEYVVKCDKDSEKCIKVYSNFYNDEFKPSFWRYIVCSPEIKNAQFRESGKYPADRCVEDFIRDEFQHLPVLSFEEWDEIINGTKQKEMKKEIVGYKLKDQSLRTAASIIAHGNTDGMRLADGMNMEDNEWYIEKLKKAGVLDLWFEPVYKEEEPEFKVGDWVVYFKEAEFTAMSIEIGDVLKFDGKYIVPINESCEIPVKGAGDLTSYLRHATPEEIKAALLAEAKRRYPVGTKYIRPTNKTEEVVTNQHFKIHDIDEEIIHGELGRGCLMFHGKWAEIITEPSQTKLTKKQIKKEIKNLLKEL